MPLKDQNDLSGAFNYLYFLKKNGNEVIFSGLPRTIIRYSRHGKITEWGNNFDRG